MKENNVNINHDDKESTTTKYMIYADFNIDGLVEKPDVVGALFGQTEGLLSEELELRELQKGGKVGRIQVYLSVRGGKTKGSISIPSSLDKVETSILAAAIETVDRIGPCNAKISIRRIEDIRKEKMKKIRERASELLQKWNTEASQESSHLTDEVLKAARIGGITHFGQLPAGPELNDSDTIIIVEGRADIAACLRAGVRNTVAVQGASVPKSVINLTKRKTVIAFLDGDRGGDLILKELLMYADIDYIARAPKGKEVEELKPDEIIDQLSKKVPIEIASFVSEIHASEIVQKAIKRKAAKKIPIAKAPYSKERVERQPIKKEAEKARAPPPPRGSPRKTQPAPKDYRTDSRQTTRRAPPRDSRRRYPQRDRRPSYRDSRPRTFKPKIPEELMPIVKEIDNKEKQEGIFLNEKLKKVKRVPVEAIYDEIKKSKGVTKVVFDGVITQRLIDACNEKKIDVIIGARMADVEKRPANLKVFTFA